MTKEAAPKKNPNPLYRDDEHKFIIRIIPCDGAPAAINIPQEGYLLRDVYSDYDLREKILIFQSGLDDRAIELLKAYTIHQNADQPNSPTSLLLAKVADDSLTFLVLAKDGTDYLLKTPFPLYQNLLSEMTSHVFDTDGFTIVDSGWIQRRVTF